MTIEKRIEEVQRAVYFVPDAKSEVYQHFKHMPARTWSRYGLFLRWEIKEWI